MIYELMASHVLAFVLSAVVLGLLVGSFLNVVIYRVPIMMQREWRMQAREYLEYPPEPIGERFNLLVPSSRCPHCGHRIRAWENIPLVSWLALRGKCSSCQAPISCRYPLVELACG
ncbi:prepilin peptidase, partial [Stutzerimonas stutzeri]